jgi:hypothetical protein
VEVRVSNERWINGRGVSNLVRDPRRFLAEDNPPSPEALFRFGLLALFPVSFAVFAFRYREKLRLSRAAD